MSNVAVSKEIHQRLIQVGVDGWVAACREEGVVKVQYLVASVDLATCRAACKAEGVEKACKEVVGVKDHSVVNAEIFQVDNGLMVPDLTDQDHEPIVRLPVKTCRESLAVGGNSVHPTQ